MSTATAKGSEEPKVLSSKAVGGSKNTVGWRGKNFDPIPKGSPQPLVPAAGWGFGPQTIELLSPTLSPQRGFTGVRNVPPGHPAQSCRDLEHWH